MIKCKGSYEVVMPVKDTELLESKVWCNDISLQEAAMDRQRVSGPKSILKVSVVRQEGKTASLLGRHRLRRLTLPNMSVNALSHGGFNGPDEAF